MVKKETDAESSSSCVSMNVDSSAARLSLALLPTGTELDESIEEGGGPVFIKGDKIFVSLTFLRPSGTTLLGGSTGGGGPVFTGDDDDKEADLIPRFSLR